MQQVVSKWGQWTPLDTSEVGMPDYSAYESRDIPSADFPEYSWQRNEDYLDDFLGQGKDLIQRVKQGIYGMLISPRVSCASLHIPVGLC
jgi:hypothetical protein